MSHTGEVRAIDTRTTWPESGASWNSRHFPHQPLRRSRHHDKAQGGVRMKPEKLMCITAIALFAGLAIPAGLAAQDKQEHNNHHKHHRYKLIDLGTFGGPQSWVFGAFEWPASTVNNAGTVVGGADTSNSNP